MSIRPPFGLSKKRRVTTTGFDPVLTRSSQPDACRFRFCDVCSVLVSTVVQPVPEITTGLVSVEPSCGGAGVAAVAGEASSMDASATMPNRVRDGPLTGHSPSGEPLFSCPSSDDQTD